MRGVRGNPHSYRDQYSTQPFAVSPRPPPKKGMKAVKEDTSTAFYRAPTVIELFKGVPLPRRHQETMMRWNQTLEEGMRLLNQRRSQTLPR